MTEGHADFVRVIVPQDNVSDDRYLLLSWNVADGETIADGDVLGEFETSKSVFELPAESAGTFYALAAEGVEVAVGDLVAIIAATELTDDHLAALRTTCRLSDDPRPSSAAPPGSQPTATPDSRGDGVRFSKAAEELIAARGVDKSRFTEPGLVRRADVERFLASAVDAPAPAPRSLVETQAVETRQVSGSSIVLVGAGGHARMLLDLLDELRCFRVVGLLDGGVATGHLVHGHRVLGPDTPEELAKLHAQGVRLAVNAVGGVTRGPARPAVWQRIRAAGFGLPTLVHRGAIVDRSAQLGEGAQILAGSYVGAGTTIGDDCIVNSGSVVSHDCVVADHAHIAPGAVLAGGVTVGANALVGMGATVYLGVTIGARAIVTNGVDVFSDTPDDAIVKKP